MAELYEYSVYGQVAASDPNHPNRFMFTGREFDKDTGLYYYRARYYHPEIGRFLQTDSIGYEAGMNLYRYCRNNPLNLSDPLGLDPCDCNDYCSLEHWDLGKCMEQMLHGGCDPCGAVEVHCDCDDPCDSNGVNGISGISCSIKPGGPGNPLPLPGYEEKMQKIIKECKGSKSGLDPDEACSTFDCLVRAITELIKIGKGASTTVIIIFDCPQFHMLCPSPSPQPGPPPA